MNNTIYRQYDSRWGGKAYPSGSTMSGCGCGCVSCTHIAIEQSSKAKWTPENLRPWMVSQGFAIRGQGTTYSGMTKTLQHIGHSKVTVIGVSDPMSKAFAELDKGNRIGILLFRSGSGPDGTVWTSSGHYVAFTDYRIKNKRHEFYCKDSGGRGHNGWYSYERSMKGRIYMMWIVERIKEAAPKVTEIKATTYRPKTPYTGSLPKGNVAKGSKGADVKAVKNFLNWCVNSKLNQKEVVGKATLEAIKVFQKTYGLTVDGSFGPACRAKAQTIVDSLKSKTLTKAEKINQTALEFAWPKGTKASVYKYPSGSANAAFKKAWKKYYSTKANRAGCHEFVRLVLRANGYPTMPLSWKPMLTYFRKHFKEIKVNYKESQIKPGDIRIRCRKVNGKLRYHIWIEGSTDGKKLLRVEASYKKKYAHVLNSNADTFKKHYKDWLFRAK